MGTPPNTAATSRELQPAPEPGELPLLLAQHEAWLHDFLTANPAPGVPATVEPVTVRPAPSRLTLQERDFRGREDLKAADLRKSVFTGSRFWDADLTDTDLTDAEGLTPDAFAGADLTRAKLPATVSFDPSLKNVEQLSQNAGKLFLSLILATVFVLLTVFKIKDAQLVTETGTATLPALNNVEMPVGLFFVVAPAVLLVLFISVHLYLQRLWEAMALLPAVFPDGTPLDRKTYPWLMSDLIRAHTPRLWKQRRPLGLTQQLLFWILAYAGLPLALLPIWAHYLCRHDGWAASTVTPRYNLTLWFHLGFITAAFWFATMFWYLGRITMARQERALKLYADWRTARQWGLALLQGAAAALLFFGLFQFTGAAINAVPAEVLSDDPQDRHQVNRYAGQRYLYKRAAAALRRVRLSGAAHLEGAELSTRPNDWKEPEAPVVDTGQAVKGRGTGNKADQAHDALLASIDKQKEVYRAALGRVKGVQLRGRDLRHARGDGAVLIRADLRGTDLRGARLAGVDLRGARLHQASLRGAWLRNADLRFAELADEVAVRENNLSRSPAIWFKDKGFDEGARLPADQVPATLRGAHLEGADLRWIRAQYVDLSGAYLRGAHLIGADLSGADLRNVDLMGAYLTIADLTGAYLGGADLRNADLTDASLTRADLTRANLIDAFLTRADLEAATLAGADLTSANLWGADLEAATLRGAHLRGADLWDADLTSANLMDADLTDADLTDADLTDVNLMDADLTDADLTGAYLSNAKLTGAIASSRTRWPSGWPQTGGYRLKELRKVGEVTYYELVPSPPRPSGTPSITNMRPATQR